MIRHSVKFTHNEELLPEVTSVQINALIISYIRLKRQDITIKEEIKVYCHQGKLHGEVKTITDSMEKDVYNIDFHANPPFWMLAKRERTMGF